MPLLYIYTSSVQFLIFASLDFAIFYLSLFHIFRDLNACKPQAKPNCVNVDLYIIISCTDVAS